MSERRPFIATYIQSSRPHGVLYVGMTANLFERGRQHRDGAVEGFASRYGCGLLVWYEPLELVTSAKRVWKLELIERTNPGWIDLYPSLCGLATDPRVKPEDDGEGSVAAFLKRLETDE